MTAVKFTTSIVSSINRIRGVQKTFKFNVFEFFFGLFLPANLQITLAATFCRCRVKVCGFNRQLTQSVKTALNPIFSVSSLFVALATRWVITTYCTSKILKKKKMSFSLLELFVWMRCFFTQNVQGVSNLMSTQFIIVHTGCPQNSQDGDWSKKSNFLTNQQPQIWMTSHSYKNDL